MNIKDLLLLDAEFWVCESPNKMILTNPEYWEHCEAIDKALTEWQLSEETLEHLDASMLSWFSLLVMNALSFGDESNES